MRIVIKEKRKTKVFLWLPSYHFVIRLVLKRAKIDGVSLNKNQIDRLMKAIKLAKKYHRHIIDIDIQSNDGDAVWIHI